MAGLADGPGMDRSLARLLETGSSIPQNLQADDTGPVADPAASGWQRVSQLRGERVTRPAQQPPAEAPEPGRPPVNLALRQFLATGASAPPGMRATGRVAQAEPEPAPAGDEGPWTGPGAASAAVPIGYESVMGQDL
jgi:hypothetical protein